MHFFPVLSDLEYVCKLMHDSFDVPVFFLNDKGEPIFEFSSNYAHNPLYPSKQELLEQLFQPDNPHDFPVFRTTSYLENFFSISIKQEHQFKGTIIVGPSIYAVPSEETVTGILGDHNIGKEKDEMIAYYHSLPVLGSLKLVNVSMHLYYMVYHEKLDLSLILQQNQSLEKKPFEIENAELSISKRRQDISVHQDPLLEKKIFQSIKNGRKEELIQNMRLLQREQMGVLSKKSHLRSEKNLGIAAITMATRSAMEGGLHPQIAYTLSDLYIQSLEELQDSKAVSVLLENALSDFADRVQKSKLQNYSKPISLCQNYIYTHLYEEITLATLAEVAAMHPNYLSVLFKKEVGISLTEYIQQAKIEEAKNLLTFSSYSITEIYTLLNFHDQSHFTKVFKKFAGVTPKQFRSKHATL